MAEVSNIEWTDSTFNPWEGCQKVGPGCDNCYAENRNARFGGGIAPNWGPGAPRRRTSAANWRQPLLWEREHAAFWLMHGRRRRVFCASLADLFDNEVEEQWRADLFRLIEQTPHLNWLLLTKRVGNVARLVPEATDLIDYGEGWQSMWGQGVWPDNVWLGATIVNQAEADRDIPKLLAVPARVRFLSIEPMLGPIDLTQIVVPRKVGVDVFDALHYDGDPDDDVDGGTATLDWVICGGESGPKARPMHPDWARSLRDQCAAADVPFLFKQHGEWIGVPDLRNLPGGAGPGFGAFDHCAYDQEHEAVRVSKKAAGRLLDGRTHDGFPGAPCA